MKRYIILLLLLFVPALAEAHQRGDKSIGVGYSYQTKGSRTGLGGRFQYVLSQKIRFEGTVDLFLPERPNKTRRVEAETKRFTSAFLFGLNLHYLIPVAEGRCSLYPLIGVAGYHSHYKLGEEDIDTSETVMHAGLGFSVDLAYYCAVGLEAKYMASPERSSPVLGLYATFHF